VPALAAATDTMPTHLDTLTLGVVMSRGVFYALGLGVHPTSCDREYRRQVIFNKEL